MMANRSKLQFKPPLTMIIPYGLKSWLESISRAILIERPKQIPEFIATYCEELLKFRECDLLMDTKDVTHRYQDIRETKHIKDLKDAIDLMHRQLGPQDQPGDPEQISLRLAEESLSVSQNTSPRSTQKSTVTTWEPMGWSDDKVPSSVPRVTHRGEGIKGQSSPVHTGDRPSSAVQEEVQARSGSAVQSVVLQRAPPGASLLEANRSHILISTACAPTNNASTFYSENLPENIAFYHDSHPSSGVSSRISLTRTLSICKGETIVVNDPTEGMADNAFAFHKVPSVKNLPRTQSTMMSAALAPEEQVMSKTSSKFLQENVVPGSPSFVEVASAATLQQAETECIKSANELKENKSCSEIVGVSVAQNVNSVRTPIIDESVGKTSENREKHTCPTVSPRDVPRLSSQTPLLSAVKELSTVSARCSEADITKRVYTGTAVDCEEISVREISQAVSAGRSASDVSERAPTETAVLEALPLLEEQSEAPTVFAFVGEISPAFSVCCVSARVPSETEMRAEAPERQTSPKVSTQTSFESVSPSIDHWDESLKAPDMSPSFSLLRIPSGCLSDVVTPAVSARCSDSDLLGSVTRVMDSSATVVLSTPVVDELLVLPTASVDRISPAISSKSSGGYLDERASSETAMKYSGSGLSGRAFSETEVVDAAHRMSLFSPGECSSIKDISNIEETYKAPSPEEVSESTTAAVGGFSRVVSTRGLASDMSESSPTKTPPEIAAHRVSSVSIAIREERGEVPSASVGIVAAESATAEIISDVKAHMASSVAGLPGSPPAFVGEISPATSARCSSSDIQERASSDCTIVGTTATSRWSDSVLSGRAFSDTELICTARSVPSVRIPSREECVGRKTETPESHTSPSVSPQTFLVSAYCYESLRAPDTSSSFRQVRIPSGRLTDGVSTAMSARFSDSDLLLERTSSETKVVETPTRAIPSELLLDDLLSSETASVDRISPTVSSRSSGCSLGERAPSETVIRYSESGLSGRVFSETELVIAAHKIPTIRIVSSVKIPSREESAGRKVHTFSRVCPQTSSLSATGLSPESSLTRVPSVCLSDGTKQPGLIDNKTLSPEELLSSPLHSNWARLPTSSKSDLLGLLERTPSETEVVDAVCQVSSVRILSREENVGRTVETHRLSPQFSPNLFPSVSPKTSLVSSPSPPFMKQQLVSPTTSVGRISPAVSRRSSRSSVPERAFSETAVEGVQCPEHGLSGRAISEAELLHPAHRVSTVRTPSREESVGRTTETPGRHTSPRVSPRMSPRVSPQSSLDRITFVPLMESLVVPPAGKISEVSRSSKFFPKISPQNSLVSAHVGESLSSTDIFPQSSLQRIHSAPTVDRQSCSGVSQRASPKSSLTKIPSAPLIAVSTCASAGRMSPAVSRTSSRSSLLERSPSGSVISYSESCLSGRAFSETELIEPACTVSSVTIPSTEENVGKTAETQTSFTSVVEKAMQDSERSIRLCEEVTANSTAVQHGTLGVSLVVSPADVFGTENSRTQNTRSQCVQTSPDDFGPTSQSFPIGAGSITPDVQPVLPNCTNQVWTLYHLANETEEGTLSTKVISQPPFNGNAYIRHFGPGHVLLAERFPSQQSDAQSCSGHSRQHPQPPPFPVSPERASRPRIRSSTLPHPPPSQPLTITNEEISIPNYFLFLDGKQLSLAGCSASVPTAMLTRSRSAVVRMDDTTGYLSFSVPMEMVSGCSDQVVSEEGYTVYPPSVIRIDTPKPAEETDQQGSTTLPN